MTDAATEARELLSRCTHGVLSTHSVTVEGYPLGSITPYVLDDQGHPLILISTIAQHTKNLSHDPKCSLTIAESDVDDVQASARLSVLADAAPIAETEAELGERYLRFFPEARGYEQAHDFNFWRLTPVRLRYIGGFGKIHWLTPDQVLRPNPFSPQQETGAVTHMNRDHADAVAKYCEFAGIDSLGQTPEMTGVDAEGLYIRIGQAVHRIGFREPVESMDALRKTTIAMCKPDYWPATGATQAGS
ncbi:DUF2470 domain-containing protein [uncultured Abyssibacter sp.]|uniref:HugZ family pyridoxamine 5'-phosphate oxidase n=1 Tax=uncultured Abyssibacter sp. TaxID=2320202 RepID=UPI0032B1C6BE